MNPRDMSNLLQHAASICARFNAIVPNGRAALSIVGEKLVLALRDSRLEIFVEVALPYPGSMSTLARAGAIRVTPRVREIVSHLGNVQLEEGGL